MGKVNPVGSGESVQQVMIIEGSFLFKDGDGQYHKITLREDPVNAGVWILTDVAQSADTPTLETQ